MKLLLFEFKKMIRTKTVLYLFLFTALFIAGIFLKNIIQQDSIIPKKVTYFSAFSSEVSSSNLGDLENLKKIHDPAIEARLEIGTHLYGLLRDLILAIETEETAQELQLENDVYRMAMTYKEMEGQFSLGQIEMDETILINEELQRVGLKKEDFDLSIEGAVFLKKVMNLAITPLGFLIVLLILGTFITREFEDHNAQLIFTLPIAKWKYIMTKFSSFFIVFIGWITFVLSLAYLLPAIFSQADSNFFKYPLLTNADQLTTIGIYVKEGTLIAICFALFAVALLLFLSFFIRHTIITYVVLFIFFIGGWIMTSNDVTHFINPFVYQEIDSVLIALPTYYPGGLAVLIISALVLLLLTISVTEKRGI